MRRYIPMFVASYLLCLGSIATPIPPEGDTNPVRPYLRAAHGWSPELTWTLCGLAAGALFWPRTFRVEWAWRVVGVYLGLNLAPTLTALAAGRAAVYNDFATGLLHHFPLIGVPLGLAAGRILTEPPKPGG